MPGLFASLFFNTCVRGIVLPMLRILCPLQRSSADRHRYQYQQSGKKIVIEMNHDRVSINDSS